MWGEMHGDLDEQNDDQGLEQQMKGLIFPSFLVGQISKPAENRIPHYATTMSSPPPKQAEML